MSGCRENIYSLRDSQVDDSVDSDGDGVSGENFLGRHVERDGSHVDTAEVVHAGDHKEDAGALRGATNSDVM